jgi:hypothetical protein
MHSSLTHTYSLHERTDTQIDTVIHTRAEADTSRLYRVSIHIRTHTHTRTHTYAGAHTHKNTNYHDNTPTRTNTQAYALVSTSLDEIAWLLNVRGSDVPCNPVSVSYAVVTTG